jgi:GMP synthase-like glutamine amidotransferase
VLRLGFLQCDNLDHPHVDVAGDYDVLFGTLLATPDLELVGYRAHHGDLPTSPRDCDAWLIPGSRHSVYDDLAWIHDLTSFTRRVLDDERPLVGVCFGHQLIGRLLGAPVDRAEAGWTIGAVRYRLHQCVPGETPNPTTSPDRFTLIASHQDQVLELPDGATLLADAPTCPVAGFTTAHVLTIQAHPEFDAPLAESLYRSRVERIGQAPVEAALATLDRPLDRSRIARWIRAFVTGRVEGGTT